MIGIWGILTVAGWGLALLPMVPSALADVPLGLWTLLTAALAYAGGRALLLRLMGRDWR